MEAAPPPFSRCPLFHLAAVHNSFNGEDMDDEGWSRARRRLIVLAAAPPHSRMQVKPSRLLHAIASLHYLDLEWSAPYVSL